MVNQERFAEVYALITEFPKLHAQEKWEADPEENGTCGTTRCVAGWAVWLEARDLGLLTRKRQPIAGLVLTQVANHLGVAIDYPVAGAAVLGLNYDESYYLFQDMNKERVLARVKSYAENGHDISDEEYDSY